MWFITCLLVLNSVLAGAPLSEIELDKILFRYKFLETISADFSQIKTVKDADIVLTSKGRFEIKLPHSVVWEILEPSPVRIQMDASEIQILKGSGPTQEKTVLKIAEGNSEELSRNLAQMMSWLKLDAHLLYSQYTVTKTEKQVMEFLPKSQGPFEKLILKLDKKGHVREAHITEKSGDSMELHFGPPRIVNKKI